MKNIQILTIILVVLFSSCNKDELNVINDTDSSQQLSKEKSLDKKSNNNSELFNSLKDALDHTITILTSEGYTGNTIQLHQTTNSMWGVTDLGNSIPPSSDKKFCEGYAANKWNKFRDCLIENGVLEMDCFLIGFNQDDQTYYADDNCDD